MRTIVSAVVMIVVCVGDGALAARWGFERDTQNWQHIGDGIIRKAEKAFRGQRAMRLGADDGGAWIVSPPLQNFTPGSVMKLSMRLKRISDTGKINVAPVNAVQRPTGAVLWCGGPEKAPNAWHHLSLKIVCGLQQPRIAIGTTDSGAEFLIDEVSLKAARLKHIRRATKAKKQPQYPDPLPPQWQPKGLMDLQTRSILGKKSYFLPIGSLKFTVQRNVTLQRGQRRGMMMDVLSRTKTAKDVHLQIAGPMGWHTEKLTLRVANIGRTTVELPLQPLTCGRIRLRAQFQIGDQIRRMPLTVDARRYYPAFGVLWRNGSWQQADLKPFSAMPAQLHQLVLGPDDELQQLKRMTQGRAELVLQWKGGVADAVKGLSKLPGQVADATGAIGVCRPSVTPEQMRHLSGVVSDSGATAKIMSSPLAVVNSQRGIVRRPNTADTTPSQLNGDVDVATVNMPPLPASAVVEEKFSGRRTGKAIMRAWTSFDRQWYAPAVRRSFTGDDVQLPLYATVAGGQSTGDRKLDAYLLSRVILHLISAGAHGISVPAMADDSSDIAFVGADGSYNAPIFDVYGQLMRELSGVRSVAPPPATDIAAYEPGKPIMFRPFIRADEAIVALWNNSSRTRRLALQVRSRPRRLRILRISYPNNKLCRREFVPNFQWSALAKRRKLPEIYLDIRPLQIVIVSAKLEGAQRGWLRSIIPRPKMPKIDKSDELDDAFNPGGHWR